MGLEDDFQDAIDFLGQFGMNPKEIADTLNWVDYEEVETLDRCQSILREYFTIEDKVFFGGPIPGGEYVWRSYLKPKGVRSGKPHSSTSDVSRDITFFEQDGNIKFRLGLDGESLEVDDNGMVDTDKFLEADFPLHGIAQDGAMTSESALERIFSCFAVSGYMQKYRPREDDAPGSTELLGIKNEAGNLVVRVNDVDFDFQLNTGEDKLVEGEFKMRVPVVN